MINSIKVNTGNIIVYTYLTEKKECKGEKEELTFFSFSLFFPQRELTVLILKKTES